MDERPICAICKEDNRLREVYVCPSCKKTVCDACCYRFGGRPFCNKRCSDFFFFGDEDLIREEE